MGQGDLVTEVMNQGDLGIEVMGQGDLENEVIILELHVIPSNIIFSYQPLTTFLNKQN